MALVLHQQVDTKLPIEVSGIAPDRLVGLSLAEIKQLPIYHGNQQLKLSDRFEVSGDMVAPTDRSSDGADHSCRPPEPTIRWTGNLQAVHWLGAKMNGGRVEVQGNAGRHLGSGMTGGEIVVTGNAGDNVGCEMTGGTICIAGNAGNLVGANYPGSKHGMNRGSIFITGNAGMGVGQSMRRGTIVVGGNCGSLAGWDMLAGTLVVLGQCGPNAGANMSRGTIVVAGSDDTEAITLPTFGRGGTGTVPVLRLLARWLAKEAPEIDASVLSQAEFTQFHGDTLKGGRGELFVAESKPRRE